MHGGHSLLNILLLFPFATFSLLVFCLLQSAAPALWAPAGSETRKAACRFISPGAAVPARTPTPQPRRPALLAGPVARAPAGLRWALAPAGLRDLREPLWAWALSPAPWTSRRL